MTRPSLKERLAGEVEEILGRPGAAEPALLAAVDRILEALDCSVGTVHAFDPESQILEVRAFRGIPDAVLEKVRRVPIGKGMAGLAAERRAPVQVCNLQTDQSGVARPDARQTGSCGSIAVPMLAGGALRGVLGVGKSVPHEFTDDESALLLRIAESLGRHIARAR
jgi:L-methionine (R)-S-oxide reductase